MDLQKVFFMNHLTSPFSLAMTLWALSAVKTLWSVLQQITELVKCHAQF